MGDGGNWGGGVDTQVHARLISLPEAGEESWVHRVWKLDFLGSGDFLESRMPVGEMRRLEIASPSSSNLRSRPSGPTDLLREHDTIINYLLESLRITGA